jgi:ribosomal protein L27
MNANTNGEAKTSEVRKFIIGKAVKDLENIAKSLILILKRGSEYFSGENVSCAGAMR